VKKSPDSEPIAFRTAAAAKVSGMSGTTIKRLIKSGELASLRVGKIRLIRRKALEEFLARRESAAE
jgi:excisionase family DNA binding protein